MQSAGTDQTDVCRDAQNKLASTYAERSNYNVKQNENQSSGTKL